MSIKENVDMMMSFVSDAASKAIESKAVAATVAGGTIGLGISGWQSTASFAATIIGIVLTLILIVRNVLGAWREWKAGRNES